MKHFRTFNRDSGSIFEIFKKVTGKTPQKTEMDLLLTFSEIMEVSKRVKREDVAKLLEISEETLFRLLVKWKNLEFIIDGDMILINNVRIFTTKLEQQLEGKEIDDGSQSDKKIKVNKDISYSSLTPEEQTTIGYFTYSLGIFL